jgi:hypothetical protein
MRRWIVFCLTFLCCQAAAPGILLSGSHLLKSNGAVLLSAAPEPLGLNLAQVAYYSAELPFLNLVKAGGSSSNLSLYTGWYTSSGGSQNDTGEEAYLQLDGNGYATSLTASPAPGGGQVFNAIYTLINYNFAGFGGSGATPPGVTYAYPPGTYRLKFEGQGTVQVKGDGTATLSNSTPNTYVSTTFTISSPGSSNGLSLWITAINSGTDYPRDISLVNNTYASSYDAGAVFNPAFLTMLTGFKSLRFMDWTNTNDEMWGYQSNSISSGATSATLTSNWGLPSGSYPIVFNDGEQRTATFTLGSESYSWTGGLTNAITSTTFVNQQTDVYFWLVSKTWANRSLPSNAFWGLWAGVPLEIQVALANAVGVSNANFNVPLMYTDANMEAEGQLVMSGTGMQSGFSALASYINASFEYSNETWNGTFDQYSAAGSLGGNTWPSQTPGGGNAQWNLSWCGMRVAQMAADLQTAVGSTLFARVIPVMAVQAADTGWLTGEMAASYWSGAPASNYSAYPIKAVAIAPYWGGNPSSGDATTMTGVATPLDDFFATLYSQTGTSANGSHTYSSVPSGGWLAQAEGWISSYVTAVASYPHTTLIAYEGGQNFFATTSGTASGWPALVTSAERDARMGTAYSAYLNYWKGQVGVSLTDINNLYNDVDPIETSGAWGLLESLQQTINPLSSAPAKYNAAASYATL